MRRRGTHSWRALTLAPTAIFLVLASVALAAPAIIVQTERVSVSSSEAQGNHGGEPPALSADGRYAVFSSTSSNLVPHDTNRAEDVFVRDRMAGKTERVSVSSTGRQGNGPGVYGASISADGRYVVFSSTATNLVPGRDPNGHEPDVFLRDRKLHKTTRVSVSTAGKKGGGQLGDISDDGHRVAFVSSNQLAPQDRRNARRDVYVRDLKTHKTELVSVGVGGKSGDWYSSEPSISANGRFVAFTSRATNLVADQKFRVTDVYVRDLKTHKTTLVSRTAGGASATRSSRESQISADGRFVSFTSSAPNLVAGDTNGVTDVFLRDLQNGTTERVSVSTSGAQSTQGSFSGAPSALGEFVVFASDGPDLAPGDANGTRDDIFVRDVPNHATYRVSVNSSGQGGNDNSSAPSISADGRFAGFWSQATNLATPDTNHKGDAFVRGQLRP
jgi:Tol biopolymer transport system component